MASSGDGHCFLEGQIALSPRSHTMTRPRQSLLRWKRRKASTMWLTTSGEACALLRIARQQFRLEISKLCSGMGNTDVRVRGTGHVSITSAIQCQAERGDPLEAQVPQCARGLAGDAQRYGLRPRSAGPLAGRSSRSEGRQRFKQHDVCSRLETIVL